MRLIDADALMAEWLKKPDPEHLTEREVKIIAQCAEDIVDAIYDAPTIDLEDSDYTKVIRCKDCKYFALDWLEETETIMLLHEVCTFWGKGCKTSMLGYCSFGERKEE